MATTGNTFDDALQTWCIYKCFRSSVERMAAEFILREMTGGDGVAAMRIVNFSIASGYKALYQPTYAVGVNTNAEDVQAERERQEEESKRKLEEIHKNPPKTYEQYQASLIRMINEGVTGEEYARYLTEKGCFRSDGTPHTAEECDPKRLLELSKRHGSIYNS